jgi:hypothetical protein
MAARTGAKVEAQVEKVDRLRPTNFEQNKTASRKAYQSSEAVPSPHRKDRGMHKSADTSIPENASPRQWFLT